MGRATVLALVCLIAASQAQAAVYGCRVKVVGAFTAEKAMHQLNAYINGAVHPPAEAKAAALYCRGQLHDLAGERDPAIADFTDSIAWNPHEASVFFARGDVYADVGERDKAEADYAEGKRLGGDTPAKRAGLCWQRAVRGRPLDRAREDCDAALKSEPDNMQWLAVRAFLRLRAGDNAAAVADFDTVLKDKPRDAAALFLRGIAKQHAGDADGGKADIAAAGDMDSHVAETYAVYGVTPEASPH
jgi:tetratricopeptide (TPR) repeat protein